MEIHVNSSKMSYVVASPCKPRLDFTTGEQRTDKATGRGIWDVTVLMGNGSDSMPIKIKLLAPVEIPQMTPVQVSGLTLTKMTMRDGAQIEIWTCDKIIPAGTATAPENEAPASGAAAGAAKPPAGQAPQSAAGKAGA